MAVTRLHILNMLLLAGLGVFILFLSLLTANRLKISHSMAQADGWRFYVGRDILPDHVMYPVLMARDRIILDTTEPTQQPALKLSYAEKRYSVAEQLFEREQGLLAISTLTKSQKYLLSAGYQALQSESTSTEELLTIRRALDHSLYRLDSLNDTYAQYDFSILIQLKEDTRALIKQIDERTGQN